MFKLEGGDDLENGEVKMSAGEVGGAETPAEAAESAQRAERAETAEAVDGKSGEEAVGGVVEGVRDVKLDQ